MFATVAVSSNVDFADSDLPQMPHATVSIPRDEPVVPVPRSYFGLSTEYWSLPLYAVRLGVFEHVLSMLRVPGDGPLVLRVGGDSSSRTFWDPPSQVVPAWVYPITESWTRLVRRLVRRLDIRLILDLNLITGSPATAAALAQAAEAELPRHSILGFEIGNEPDIYSHSAWRRMARRSVTEDRLLPPSITRAGYIAEFRTYADAVRASAPGVSLLGPALAQPQKHESWAVALIASHEAGLATITGHRYSFSGCTRRRSPRFPTIRRILSRSADTNLASSVTGVLRAAHRAGLRFRLDELNSVNCGGRGGLSDAFATALWAPGALFDLLRAGVDGVNVHIRADTINAPFAVTPHGLIARPLLYGLLIFTRTLGSHPALVPLRLRARRALDLQAWAIRSAGDDLHVLVVDEGRRPVRVALRLPTRGPLTIERLLAPSPWSRAGVTLDGQWLGRNASWHGTASDDTVAATKRGYVVIVPRFSAALLSARLLSGALVYGAPTPELRPTPGGLRGATVARRSGVPAP
jgi:hypothetical protein